MLAQVRRVLEAGEQMDRQAAQLAGGLEARLTLVVSDTYQSDRYEQTLAALEARFPDLELECLIAEHEDVVDLIRQDRAQFGLVASQPAYPPDIGAATISEPSEIGLFVGRQHPLARHGDAETPHADLRAARELRLNTMVALGGARTEGPDVGSVRRWSAPSYIMLLEMAALGYGWTELPRWMVERFAADRLHEVRARGWPRRVPVDAVVAQAAAGQGRRVAAGDDAGELTIGRCAGPDRQPPDDAAARHGRREAHQSPASAVASISTARP